MPSENGYCYVDTERSEDSYLSEQRHVSYPWARQCRGKFGGRAQRAMEFGVSLFRENRGTEIEWHFDSAFQLLVEKKSWDKTYAVVPAEILAADGSKRSEKYRRWCGRVTCSGPWVKVMPKTFEQLRSIADSIMEHRRARELVEATISTRTSVFWQDRNGYRRKARADAVTGDIWYGVKTTTSDWKGLKERFREDGFDWEAAWNVDAAVQSGYADFTMPFLCVQTFAPYNVEVFTLPKSAVDRARREIEETLALIQKRRQSGEYLEPSYGDQVEMEWKSED